MKMHSQQYFFENGGYKFESEMVDILSDSAKHLWGDKSVKFSTKQQDRFEGTDLFVLGVPMDITLAFDKKNKTRRLGTISMDGITINFGVRFGNGKANFKTPVLVMGAEAASGITNNNMWVALDTIKSNIREILDVGMDKYLLATEA
jgi:hypothetical protein